MANLLETLRKNSQSLMGQKQAISGDTEKVAAALRAKSGKAGTSPEIAQSDIEERAAVASSNAALRQQVVPQLQLQQAQADQAIRQQAQETEARVTDIAQTRRANDVENRIRTNELLQQAEQERGSLDYERDRASAEQISHNLRLQNKSYTDNLQREGARNRINTDMGFREQMARTVFEDNQTLAKDRNAMQAVLNGDQREYEKQLAKMGVDDLWAMFRQDMRDAQSQANWTAINGIFGGGISAYGAYQEKKSDDAFKKKMLEQQSSAGSTSTATAATASKGSK